MASKTAPIDKIDIYVSAQNLYKKIYSMQGRINKKSIFILTCFTWH